MVRHPKQTDTHTSIQPDTDAWASDKDTPAPSVYKVQFAQQLTSDTDPEDLYNELVNEHGEFVNETTVSLEQVP